MNERLKELRKELHLTMEQFASMIGYKKNAISEIENGRNKVTDRMANSICQTNFDGRYVSEEWLRTGSGPMFVEMTRNQIIFAFADDVVKDLPDSFRRAFVEQLAQLSPDGWRWLQSFCEEVMARIPDPEKENGSGDDAAAHAAVPSDQ